VEAEDFTGDRCNGQLLPKNPIFSIGYLQARQGNFSAAYRQAVALNPNNANFLYALGYSGFRDNAGAATAPSYHRAGSQLSERLPRTGCAVASGNYNAALWAYVVPANLIMPMLMN